ncbi:hypothetical protein A9Q99_07680 [Gammaproteobacteria bacterium 45_16_T64]|nr:hypothetical protein A9Q99_07680 [Gammaproteobacteria bacterium 45_16_T64]
MGKRKGFTLVEMLVTVAIVGVLLTISVPSFVSHIQKASRAEAAAKILELAAALTKVKVTTMSYRLAEGEDNDSKDYQIRVSLDDDSGYIIKATPIGSQSNDQCGEMLYYAGGLWEFENGFSYDDCVG